MGPTSITITTLKENINVLLKPLILIINQPFEQGIFPEILRLLKSHQFTKRKTLSQLVLLPCNIIISF